MINTMKLRKILGWLGMLLPIMVAVLYMIFEVHAVQLPQIGRASCRERVLDLV